VAIVGDESSVRAQIERIAEAGVTDFVASVFGDRRRTHEALIGASKA
jgi:hypothetical protein